MTEHLQQGSWISRIRRRAAVTALTLVLLSVAAMTQSAPGPAYSYKVLYDFCSLQNCADGTTPLAPVVRDTKGNLYGTAGNVFKLTQKGKETVLYTFTGEADGGAPYGGLVRDSAGNLYGTTEYGGDLSCDPSYGCGTVFKVDAKGKETVLHSFKGGTDGMRPYAGLIRDTAGNLYGTTEFGGSTKSCSVSGWGCGTVFKLTKTGKEIVLYTFAGGADSFMPEGGLVMDAKGNLYGTTYGGGTASPWNGVQGHQGW